MKNGTASDEKPPVLKLLRWGLLLCLVVVVGFTIDAVRRTFWARQESRRGEEATVRTMGLVSAASRHLAAQFADAHGRLLADAPGSDDQILDPPTLVVAHLVSSDAETPSVAWGQFDRHLAKVTGRKVIDRQFDNSPAQLALIKSGEITIVALHAADAPFLVDNYGYQPAAVLGDTGGASGNHLDIIVPAKSPIQKTSELRGHSLVCTLPSSITGYRAAIVYLMQKDALRPNVDYPVVWSLGQKKSILGIAKGEYEAAAVSDDKLQSLLQRGLVTAADYRIIYQSQVIPRTTIGWFYNLKPELAAKVREAILSFRPEPKAQLASDGGASDDSDDSDSNDASAKMHFLAVDYKSDFQQVRQIDDSFDPRLDTKTKAHSPTTAP